MNGERGIIMKKLICGLLFCLMFIPSTTLAEGANIYGAVPLDNVADVELELPSANGTGNRPTVENGDSFSLTMEESALPFVEIAWDASMEEVIDLTGGQLSENQFDVIQTISIPHFNEPQTAVYHLGDSGLESVSIILQDGISSAGDVGKEPAGKILINLMGDFFNTTDADKMMRLKGEAYYCYKSVVSDVVLGFIPDGKSYKFGIVFNKPASFDQSIFRDDTMYAMTTESNGTLDYNAVSSRTVTLNINEQYKIQVAFTSGVQMHGAGLTSVNCIPRFRVVFVYYGLAEPKDVNTIIFTVDNQLYQFTVPDGYISGGYRDEGIYRYQYSLLMGEKNAEFMEALANTDKEVNVELRGEGFNISFPFIDKARKPVIEDWNNFKLAGGIAPLYGLAADETPMTIY